MAIGIYKPGQGYWVRVLTASMLGVVILATAAWVWKQAELVTEKMPRSVWTLPLTDVSGSAPGAGARVVLQGKAENASTGAPLNAETIGTAEVVSYDADNRALRVRHVEMAKPSADPSRAGTVLVGDESKPAFKARVTGVVSSAAAVEPVAVQGAMVALVMILGAMLTYWFVAMRPGSVEFLISTDTEMKKVNWSNRADIRKQTIVVIAACFLLTLALFIFDWFFQEIFRRIGLLTS